jgi:hypothetical protein
MQLSLAGQTNDRGEYEPSIIPRQSLNIQDQEEMMMKQLEDMHSNNEERRSSQNSIRHKLDANHVFSFNALAPSKKSGMLKTSSSRSQISRGAVHRQESFENLESSLEDGYP